MAIELQDKIKLTDNAKRIQELLTGDDIIARGAIALKEKHFQERNSFTVWLDEDERHGISVEIRPAR